MTAITSRTLVPAAALTVALLMSACGRDDPDALVASAQDYLSRNDAPAAIIQLKNALQSRPDSAKARLLLGEPCWTRAMRRAPRPSSERRRTWAYPCGSRAAAGAGLAPEPAVQQDHLRLCGPAACRCAGAGKPADHPGHCTAAPGRRGKGTGQPGRSAQGQGRLRARADRAGPEQGPWRRCGWRLGWSGPDPRQSPVGAEALKLRGDILLHSKRDADAAMAAYRDALEVKPSYVEGQAAIVELLISQGKTTAAAESLQALEKAAPGRPQTLYLQAMLAYTKGTSKRRRKTCRSLCAWRQRVLARLNWQG